MTKKKLEITYVPVNQIRVNPRNPRKHDEEQIELIADSIKKFGWQMPILVSQRDSSIIAGHGRYQAAKLLKLKVVPVVFCSLKEFDALAMMIRDNKLADEAEWDPDILQGVLAELDGEEADLRMTGFTEDELKKRMQRIEDEAGNDDSGGGGPDAEIPDQQFGVYVDCGGKEQQEEVTELCKEKGWEYSLITL